MIKLKQIFLNTTTASWVIYVNKPAINRKMAPFRGAIIQVEDLFNF
jgi:hypothetical protein